MSERTCSNRSTVRLSDDYPSSVLRRQSSGFTLIEMLVVIAIIGIFIGVIGFAFRKGGSDSVGLQAAQAQIVGLLTLARSQAAVEGKPAGVFVCNEPGKRDRFLRYVIVAVETSPSSWKAVNDGVQLPVGCYVLPNSVPKYEPDRTAEEGADWGTLKSTALRESLSAALISSAAEQWIGLKFTERGSTGDSGDIVIATGRPNAPSVTVPFVFTNPDNVRGVSVSSHGLTRVVNDADGF